MSDVAEGILSLLFGGFIFILFGKALGHVSVINLQQWGMIYILSGVILGIVVAAAALAALLR